MGDAEPLDMNVKAAEVALADREKACGIRKG